MRKRHEVWESWFDNQFDEEPQSGRDSIFLEVLLDIRELLQGLQPLTIMTGTEVESDDRDEGLHSQNHIHP